MQIKELIIKNFKSFDYTKIPFAKGLFVVVGPNGSGKSNIVDALLFVFGSTSLKRLRVDKLTNLINHHTKANTARVRVVFEHNGEDFEIIREIDKTGKSIFSLNGSKKTLNQISSFLSEIGLDTDGYNTVQQGDVTRIINLKSEERREIIDDVSGISLFDQRKKEAEDNLKKVSLKLEKVNIALKERKPYVDQLREEKESALKFKELEDKEKTYTYNLYNKQINFYKQEIKKDQDSLESLEDEINSLIFKKNDYNKKSQEIKQELEDINSKLIEHSENVQENIGKRLSEVLANKEILQNSIKTNKDSLDYFKNDVLKNTKDLENLREKNKQLDIEIKEIKENINKLDSKKQTIKIELDKNRSEYEKYKNLQKQLYEDLSNYNKDIVKDQDILFDKKNKLQAYIMQKESVLEKKEKDRVELTNLEDKKDFHFKNISNLEKEINILKKEIENFEFEKTKYENDLEKLNNDLQKNRYLLSNKRKDLSLSLNILKKRDEIKDNLKNFNSFLGFLDDFVKFDSLQKSYYSSYIVLKDDLEVQDILNKTNDLYNLSFVILSSLNIKKEDLKDYIKNKQTNVKNIKNFYFDGFSYKPLLFKDTQNIEKEINDLKNIIESIEKEIDNLKNKINNLENNIESKKSDLLDKNINYNTSKKIYENIDNDIVSLKSIKSNYSINNILSNISSLEKEIYSLKNDLDINISKKEDLENKLKEINLNDQNNLRDEFDEIIYKINDLKQSLVEKNSEQKSSSQRIESILSLLDDLDIKIKNTNKKLENLETEDKKINSLKQEIEDKKQKEDSKKSELYSKKSELNNELNNLSNQVYEIENQISQKNNYLNDYKISISTNDSKLSQIENNLKFLEIENNLKQELDLDFEKINTELRRIKREKNSLGNINFNAIKSYDKLAKEYDEILEKCQVLEKEKQQVVSMLSEINMKKQTVFIDCFEQINKTFKDIIKKMSGSISGNLELIGDDILKSKLLINITKNKKTKDIDIMSGGEKTITALAFIFSIHAYKKAPFYILDEVDAALDDFNSHTLLNFVKDISKTTTVISVSHNSNLVSGANKIIGVSLKENTSVVGLSLN